ncbi:MAG: stage IV sporulation protein A [Ruminococcaceae bacterium]|nr:stage IV sporulation protein A [Oscillospiraceae bacterium]
MNLYEDIAKRTNGEIYIGVVGPVRSGKSTFVKKFMDTVVIPNMEAGYSRERALDETPQSASGRTIMTTEPKFIPDEAVSVTIGSSKMKVRLIDCVGYLVDGAIGATENGETRMVMTPWDKEPMEFERAAELGTKKVINDHSTVGVVVTTDGTIGDIERSSYLAAEERVINELKQINKPFVIILNSSNPTSKEARELALSLEEKYSSPVALVNALELTNEDFDGIIELLLGQFGINEIKFNFPKYFTSIEDTHWLKQSLINTVKAAVLKVRKIDDVKDCISILKENENVYKEPSPVCNLGSGEIEITLELLPELYYKVMSELCGFEIKDDEDLFLNIKNLAETKKEFDKFSKAIDEVNTNGYGIVLPSVEDMSLEEPEMVRQSGGYGVKLKATAPSIHLIKANIETEINPIVGTEEQAQEIVKNMIEEIEEEPQRIWDFNIFGKSLYELVNDGLEAKLEHISEESRAKLSDTLARVINEGSNGLICIIL